MTLAVALKHTPGMRHAQMKAVRGAYLEQGNSYQGVEAGHQDQTEAAGAARPLQADDAMAQRPAG